MKANMKAPRNARAGSSGLVSGSGGHAARSVRAPHGLRGITWPDPRFCRIVRPTSLGVAPRKGLRLSLIHI